MKNNCRIKKDKGQVMLLTVLIMGAVMIASATIGGYLVMLKIRQSANITYSNRAVYAADAGIECDLYKRVNNIIPADINDVCPNTELSFSDPKTTVKVERSVLAGAQITKSIGTYNNISRAFQLTFGAPAASPGTVTCSGITPTCNTSLVMDGDIVNAQAWATDTAGPGAWIKDDLGAGNAVAYRSASIYVYAAGYGGNYSVQYSDDDNIYIDAALNFIPNLLGWNIIGWPSVGSHRYWRIYLTNTPQGHGTNPWFAELVFGN